MVRLETARSESLTIDPGMTVVVPTGDGARFHRPGWFVFETACKTEFNHPIREVAVAEAVKEGFTPCLRSACFGDWQ